MAPTPPHVLVFPAPLKGHLSPMLKLAEVLSIEGLFVTLLTTDHAGRQLGLVDARLSRCPGVSLRSIPDGLAVDHPRTVGQFKDALRSLNRRSREEYRDLLVSLSEEADDGRPPVTCAIVDAILPSAAEVTEELGIPVMAFHTSGPCSFWTYLWIPKLIEQGEVPFPGKRNLHDEPRTHDPCMFFDPDDATPLQTDATWTSSFEVYRGWRAT